MPQLTSILLGGKLMNHSMARAAFRATIASRKLGRLAAITLAVSISGCASKDLHPELAPLGGKQVNPAGANGLIKFETARVHPSDLASLICPERVANYRPDTIAKSGDGKGKKEKSEDPIVDALSCFSIETERASKQQAKIAASAASEVAVHRVAESKKTAKKTAEAKATAKGKAVTAAAKADTAAQADLKDATDAANQADLKQSVAFSEAAAADAAITAMDIPGNKPINPLAIPSLDGLITRRNAVQGYLFMRSDQVCALWITYIERAGAINRGTLNILSVIAGGAGALVSGGASQILAGTAGIFSGTGAAIDAAMLHGLTEGLLIPRVGTARATKRTAIEAKLGNDLKTYPMSAAISDALAYHGMCNISAALQADTPAATFGPYLDQMATIMAQVSAVQAVNNGGHKPVAADVSKGALFVVGTAPGISNALKVTDIAGDTGSKTVTFQALGGDATQTETLDKFMERVKNGLVFKSN